MKIRKLIARIVLAATTILMVQLSLNGQENFIPGFIIQKDGDTIRGLVDYRNWGINPDIITFKGTDGIFEYTPITIKGFGVKEEIYKSATIKTEESPENSSDLKLDPSLDLVTRTTFLQAVIIGDKSLYFYKGKNAKEQFYIPQDTSFEFLVHKKYLVDREGTQVIAENKMYIGQLVIYLQDCPGMRSKIYSCYYRKSSLEKLFLNYYNCIKSPIEFHKETEKLKIEFGALAGVSLTKVIFHSNSYEYLVYAGYPLSVNFSGGLYMDLIMPRGQRRWSLDNELLFTTYQVEGQYTDYQNENKYTNYSTTLGFSYIKLVNMLRYKQPVGNFFIYGNAGWSNGVMIASTNKLIKDEILFTQERIEEGPAIESVRKWEVGLIGGIGVKYNRFSIEARFERASGMNWEGALRSGHMRYYFLLGCRI
jgi:hypothetical protein